MEFAHHAKILLVDDNDMTRDMIRALLERASICVVEVSNGLDAIDTVATEEFDLVLMDIQMPGLDGRSAAREIRNLEFPHCKTVPIIAMTANTFSEFRVESLAAGMNGHVGKPIDLKALYSELKRWLPSGSFPQLDSLLSLEESESSPLVKMLPRVDVQAGLRRVAGDQQLYLDLLKRFVSRFSTLEADLETLMDNGDKAAAVRYAHTLKGVSGGLGATTLQQLAGKLETQLSQSEKPSMVVAVVEELNLLLAEMKAALEWRSQTLAKQAKHLGDPDALEVLLEQLKEPLINLQVQQAQQGLLQIKAMEWPQKHCEKLMELEILITEYQFAAAASLIESLLASPQ